jgi:hypothetical protein
MFAARDPAVHRSQKHGLDPNKGNKKSVLIDRLLEAATASARVAAAVRSAPAPKSTDELTTADGTYDYGTIFFTPPESARDPPGAAPRVVLGEVHGNQPPQAQTSPGGGLGPGKRRAGGRKLLSRKEVDRGFANYHLCDSAVPAPPL